MPASGCSAFEPADARGGLGAAAIDQAGHGFDLANLDRSVSPCDDFYKFANGGWMKNNPVPADRSTWATYSKLMDRNEDALHQILEEAASNKSAAPGSNLQKIGDFYASCMDESQAESVGIKPLDPEFKRIAAIDDVPGLQAEIARLQRVGVDLAFGFGSTQDFKDSTQVIADAGQGGLGLPDRQYYLDDDEHSKQLRAGYIQHVTNMFKLMGDDDPTAASEANTVMASKPRSRPRRRSANSCATPRRNYHMMTLVQLADLTPHFSWPDYFKQVGAPNVTHADVEQPDVIKAVDAALISVPLDHWKTYLRWRLIHDVAPTLSKKFVDENFDIYSRQLTGAKQLLPRWQRCVHRPTVR